MRNSALKKGLGLGALMAFVITGSGLAHANTGLFINGVADTSYSLNGCPIYSQNDNEQVNPDVSLNTAGLPELNKVEVLAAAGKDAVQIKGGHVTLGNIYMFSPHDPNPDGPDPSQPAVDVIIKGDINMVPSENGWCAGNVNLGLTTENSYFEGGILGNDVYDTMGNRNVFSVIDLRNGGTWKITKPSLVHMMEIGNDAKIIIDGPQFKSTGGPNDVYAINALIGKNMLEVTAEAGHEAHLIIENAEANSIYNIANNFDRRTIPEDLAHMKIETANALNNVETTWLTKNSSEEIGDSRLYTNIQAVIIAREAEDIPLEDNKLREMLHELNAMSKDENAAYNAAKGFVEQVLDRTKAEQGGYGEEDMFDATEKGFHGAESAGNSSIAVGVAGDVANRVEEHANYYYGPTTLYSYSYSGKGVGLLEEDSGAAVWAEYLHGKDKTREMPMDGYKASFDNEYDGVLVGLDFKTVAKYHSGLAFSYGEGDSHSVNDLVHSKGDYDFWSMSYYGGVVNEKNSVSFDVGYTHMDNDGRQNNLGGTLLLTKAKNDVWTAGVKVNRLYQKDALSILPYAGLRFMTMDTANYAGRDGAGNVVFNYAPERQNVWLLPVGVKLQYAQEDSSGWTWAPKLDLSYIWAMGDTERGMDVTIPGITNTANLQYTVMDDGSFLGALGVEASKDDWTFAVGYSYQDGDYSSSDKWYLDARYSF